MGVRESLPGCRGCPVPLQRLRQLRRNVDLAGGVVVLYDDIDDVAGSGSRLAMMALVTPSIITPPILPIEPRYGMPWNVACTGILPWPPSVATTSSGTSTRWPPDPRPEGRMATLGEYRVTTVCSCYSRSRSSSVPGSRHSSAVTTIACFIKPRG